MTVDLAHPHLQSLCRAYAERRKPIVFWIGAGLSRPAQVPLWSELRKQMADTALELIKDRTDAEADADEAKIEEARVTEDLWRAFTLIEDVIGRNEFRDRIREIFSREEVEITPPPIYNTFWQLQNVNGIVSLNIDDYASRAYPYAINRRFVNFTGRQVKAYINHVARQMPFVAQLHGNIDDFNSWVFTERELKKLLRDQNYVLFIDYIFVNFTVVFLGITADDTAVGGFLSALVDRDVDVGTHYWITDRNDSNAHRWARDAGVRRIVYSLAGDPSNSHERQVTDILEHIENYVSLDRKPDVIAAPVAISDQIPPMRSLLSEDADEIRKKLASFASGILHRNNNDTQSLEYTSFITDYRRAIHQAWFVSDKYPDNRFFGMNVSERIASSPFSSIWKLYDDQGYPCALKIVSIENLTKGPQIESFRRGVESLSFLSQAGVPGTAKLRAAYEMPPSVIMDFVDGQNLFEIVKSNRIDFWLEGLPILIELCTHLNFSHNLPQGVLHRDIRPSNVMLPNFTDNAALGSDARFKIVLLNYDMSWHLHAKGATKSGNIEEAGCYAPEYLTASEEKLTRTTKVDSYGLGMTMYFVCSGHLPPKGGSMAQDWPVLLKSATSRIKNAIWESAHERLRRLIEWSVSPEANSRANIAQILAELQSLYSLTKGHSSDPTPDYLAEEVMAHVVKDEYSTEYGVDFLHSRKAGRELRITGDLRRQKVLVEFRNMAVESTDRTRVAKAWSGRLHNAKQILESGGWQIGDGTNFSQMTIHLRAEIGIQELQADISRYVDSLSRGLDHVRLD